MTFNGGTNYGYPYESYSYPYTVYHQFTYPQVQVNQIYYFLSIQMNIIFKIKINLTFKMLVEPQKAPTAPTSANIRVYGLSRTRGIFYPASRSVCPTHLYLSRSRIPCISFPSRSTFPFPAIEGSRSLFTAQKVSSCRFKWTYCPSSKFMWSLFFKCWTC